LYKQCHLPKEIYLMTDEYSYTVERVLYNPMNNDDIAVVQGTYDGRVWEIKHGRIPNDKHQVRYSTRELQTFKLRDSVTRFDVKLSIINRLISLGKTPRSKIYFATSNHDKVREVEEILGFEYQIGYIPIEDVMATSANQLAQNCKQKMFSATQKMNPFKHKIIFTESTRLFIDDADGAPGAQIKEYWQQLTSSGIISRHD